MKFILTTVCFSLAISGYSQNYTGVYEGYLYRNIRGVGVNDDVTVNAKLVLQKATENKYVAIVTEDNKEYYVAATINGDGLVFDNYAFSQCPPAQITNLKFDRKKLIGVGTVKKAYLGQWGYFNAEANFSLDQDVIPLEVQQKIKDDVTEPKISISFSDWQLKKLKYFGSLGVWLQFNNNTSIGYTLDTKIKLLDDRGDIYTINKDSKKTNEYKSYVGSQAMSNSKQFLGNFFSDFNVSNDSFHIQISVTNRFNGKLLFQQSMAVQVEPFFLYSKTMVSVEKNARLKTINKLFNFSDSKSNSADKKSLDSLIGKGDYIAEAWKGFFIYNGIAGFVSDNIDGKAIMKNTSYRVLKDGREDNVEALYLLYNLLKTNSYLPDTDAHGIQTSNYISQSSPEYLLDKACDANFPFAIFEKGFSLVQSKNTDSIKMGSDLLNKAYSLGINKAAIPIGDLYKDGVIFPKDMNKAREWYNKIASKNDAEGILALAMSYINSSQSKEDIDKGLEEIKLAADLGNMKALDFMAEYTFNKIKEDEKYVDESINWSTKGAEADDPNAMYTLGARLYSGNYGLKYKDVAKGLLWIKKAAENSNAYAMEILGVNEIEANVIKTRYWLNQAKLKGVGKGATTTSGDPTLLTAIGYLDFSPRRLVKEIDEGGNVVSSYYEGPTIFEVTTDAIAHAADYYNKQTQEIIDGMEFIQSKYKKDIYAGTASSLYKSNIRIRKGQVVTMEGSGSVTSGFFAGTAGPAGMKGFESYSIEPKLPFGCLMAKFGSGDWIIVGGKLIFTAYEDCDLTVAVNDKDFKGHKGYFDYVMEVIK